MEARDIKPTKEIYMALLRSFSQDRDIGGAGRIATTTQFAGFQPSLEPCALLVEAYGHTGDPDQLEKDGFEPGVATCTVLVDWFGELQVVDEVEQLLDMISVHEKLNASGELCQLYFIINLHSSQHHKRCQWCGTRAKSPPSLLPLSSVHLPPLNSPVLSLPPEEWRSHVQNVVASLVGMVQWQNWQLANQELCPTNRDLAKYILGIPSRGKVTATLVSQHRRQQVTAWKLKVERERITKPEDDKLRCQTWERRKIYLKNLGFLPCKGWLLDCKRGKRQKESEFEDGNRKTRGLSVFGSLGFQHLLLLLHVLQLNPDLLVLLLKFRPQRGQPPPSPFNGHLFRPAGIAPALTPATQTTAREQTEPQPVPPRRAATESQVNSQPVSPSRETGAASVPPSPSRETPQAITASVLPSPSRSRTQPRAGSQTQSPSRETPQSIAASVLPSPSRTRTQPQAGSQTQSPSRETPQSIAASVLPSPSRTRTQPQASSQTQSPSRATPRSRAASMVPSPSRTTSQPQSAAAVTVPQTQSSSGLATQVPGRKSPQLSSPSKTATQMQPAVSQSPSKKLQRATQEISQPPPKPTQSDTQQDETKPAPAAEPVLESDAVTAATPGPTPVPALETPAALQKSDPRTIGADHPTTLSEPVKRAKEDIFERKKTTTISPNGENIKTARTRWEMEHMKHPMGEKSISIVTLAGENRGATMNMGFESTRKDGSIHIHRGYKINPDESSEATTDGEGSSKGRSSKDPLTKEPARKACINSNTQSVNNSMLFETSVSERNPGVQLNLSYIDEEPSKNSSKPVHLETRKAEFQVTPAEKLSYEPTVKRRCLRGLFMESSDSDLDNPEKPRRHGCRYDCGKKS
ncbi:hypothetical protein OIU78_012720 [Salix suchowensis]|nr:hypothetical protein OIU78_012720 [Salix suchowensis]